MIKKFSLFVKIPIVVLLFAQTARADNTLEIAATDDLLSKKRHPGAADIRRGIRQKRRESDKITSHYKICKDVNLSSLKKSCYQPSAIKITDLDDIKNITSAIQSQNFREKIQKRVVGKIESKIFKIKMVRACIGKDQNWFVSKKLEWNNIKNLCEKKSEEIRSTIKKNWSPMRINLALGKPALREDRILSDKATWFDPTPTHSITSEFSKLPKLTQKEKKQAEKIYVKNLSKVPLKQLGNPEFKQRLMNGTLYSRTKDFTSKDEKKLRMAQINLRKKSQQNYLETMSALPILGYLENGNPNDNEIKKALAKIESALHSLLKKANSASADMRLLLSFDPLVKELLNEEKNYCLAAEKARIDAKKSDRRDNYISLGLGALSAAVCLIKGPLGATICLSSGISLGLLGYRETASAKKNSLGRVMTGKEFETMAELKEKEKEELLTKLFLPLSAWGTTAVPMRAASNTFKKVIKNIKPSILKEQKKRLLSSYNSLLKNRSTQEQDIIMQTIIGMEGKGMQKQTILQKIRTAIGRCSVK